MGTSAMEKDATEEIAVSEFRANLPKYLKRVMAGNHITITLHGLPQVCLVPAKDTTTTARQALRKLRKNARVGDVVTPIGESWKVVS